MNAQQHFPDATASLLAGFSPYLARVILDLPTNSIEFHLLDRVESPITVRVLRFQQLASLQVTPHDPEDTDPLFIDSIIGVQRTGLGFDFHTDKFAISFRCGALVESTRAA